MFTDMVGYTALGQKNESLSLAVVEDQRKLIRPILKKHHGREVKTMGDAFLVDFPSALEAVRCARDIQKASREFNRSVPAERKLRLRIGIHLGDVIESNGDISGDAVNVASRIELLAEDGGVCLTRQVYDQVQNKFELPLTSLGAKLLKNVSAPVEVYRMVMPWNQEGATTPVRLDRRRVAVLPFANISPDPSDEFFADGLTEETITTLSQLPELQVIARTSVMSYKGGTKHVSVIGEELKVGSVLEGSVRKAGRRLRITVQLIDASSEAHVWSKNYDRELDDIFAIQTDVAKQVAEALQVRLLSDDKRRLEKAPTSSVEAYTLYLKARSNSQKGTKEGYMRSIGYCEAAVADDPDFALAYTELAFSYNSLGFFGMIPSKEASESATKYAGKALELDDSLAESHLVMARVLRNWEWDFVGAEREAKRAVELNPSLAEAYGTSALLKMFNRHFDDGITEIGRALDLDPQSSRTSQYAGTIFLYSGRYDDAIEQFTRALEIDPDNEFARNNRGLAQIQKGIFETGLEDMRRVSRNPSTQSDLAYAYAKSGKLDELKKLLSQLLDEVVRNPEVVVAIASAYANLGDPANAFEWLERAFRERSAYLTSLNADFVFDIIRSEPRFQTLMRKVGWTKLQ
jgi:TolB-like protein/Tfp pilus assembly protein PilF